MGILRRLVSFVPLMMTLVLPRAIVAQTGNIASTPLEAFAARSGATMVWSRTIGQLESPVARAIIEAVAFEDPANTPRTMRGLRIGLAHLVPNPDCNLIFRSHAILCARANAAIYFEEDSFQRVRAGLERGNAEQSLIFSFTAGASANSTGLVIGGYNFPGHQPQELITMLDRAMSELKNAPQ
jgi:hypothetical protein